MGNEKAQAEKAKGLFRQLIGGDMKDMLKEGKDALKIGKEELPIIKEKILFMENVIIIDFLLKYGNVAEDEKKEMINEITKKIMDRL